jgi:hypothetical protein
MKLLPYQRLQKVSELTLWLERIVAIVAAANFGLILFDLTYVPWRDFYFRRFPPILHQLYDRVKGIEPNRETQQYLQAVDELRAIVNEKGIGAAEVESRLEELRQLSATLIDENPFQVAGKTVALEKIKKEMRDRMDIDSATEAFERFWNRSYLTEAKWPSAMNFYDRKIRSRLEINYSRGDTVTGEFIDYFWAIELPFLLCFGVEFLLRTWVISRRNPGVQWFEAMLWRWYDVFLFLPVFPLLQILPVAIRLDRAKLLNLKPVWKQMNRGLVAHLAGPLTEVVSIQVINQIQSYLKNDLKQWLEERNHRYIDLNNIDEVEALFKRVIHLSVYNVFPKIKPDLEALLHHVVDRTLKGVPIYQGLYQLPGLGDLSKQMNDQMLDNLVQIIYDNLRTAIEDPIGVKLVSQLAENFRESLLNEVQQPHNLEEFQSLISDFLDEVKINYVKRLEQEDIEKIVAETEKLRNTP